MASSEWEIPPELQPDPTDHDFDLDEVMRSVVGVKAMVPADAFTAQTLGTERLGSGVVIRPDGLIATIGYIVTEAETIWLTTHDGRAIPGHALAYDFETGFGLIQALGKLNLPALPIETGDAPRPGDTAVLASAGGRKHALRCTIAARQEFAGYWEYLLEDAIFTAPAHPSWGGAGLIGGDRQADGHRLPRHAAAGRQGPPGRPQHGGAGQPAAAGAGRPAGLRPAQPPGPPLARPLCGGGRGGRGRLLHGAQRPGAEGGAA